MSKVRLERQPAAVERGLRRFAPWLRGYFGAEVRHLDRVPDGPVVLVANHNIGVPWEALALLEGWTEELGADRALYALAHPLPLLMPIAGPAARRLGAVELTREAADEAIVSGASVLVFPGGVAEETRPFWQRRRSDFHGRKGWARIALDSGVPVVPVSIVGTHAINPVLWQSRLLAWLTLMRIMRVTHFPLTIGQLLLPGVAIGAGLLAGHPWIGGVVAYFLFTSPLSVFMPLLPSKITIEMGEPVDVAAVTEQHGDDRDARLQAAYELVTEQVQEGMDRMHAERSGFLG